MYMYGSWVIGTLNVLDYSSLHMIVISCVCMKYAPVNGVHILYIMAPLPIPDMATLVGYLVVSLPFLGQSDTRLLKDSHESRMMVSVYGHTLMYTHVPTSH